MKFWDDEKSITLTRCVVVAALIGSIAMTLGGPWVTAWFIAVAGLRPSTGLTATLLVLGYACAAGLIAAFKERADSLFGRVLLLVLGMLSCYIPGTLWLMMLTGRTAAEALPLAVYPFLPGDAVKIITAAVLAPKLREALRRAA